MVKGGRVLVSLFLLWAGLCASARAADVNYLTPRVTGVPVNVVVINLNTHRYVVRPIVAHTSRSDRFMAMVRATHALAAINGTYFDTSTLRTLGSIVENGRLVYEGYVGNAIAVDKTNTPIFLKVNRENGRHVDWKPYRFAICSGPTLVYKSHVALNPWAEGFHDPHVFNKATRSAIGVTRDHRLMLVTVHRPVALSQLARIMQTLGAEYALNLDGGSSSALYYNGSVITRPNRGLTNILTICPLRRLSGSHLPAQRMDNPAASSTWGLHPVAARRAALVHRVRLPI